MASATKRKECPTELTACWEDTDCSTCFEGMDTDCFDDTSGTCADEAEKVCCAFEGMAGCSVDALFLEYTRELTRKLDSM